MSLQLRIILIIAAVITFLLIMRRIHKNQLNIDDSIFWILFSIAVIIIAVFPQIIEGLAFILGVSSPANVLFLGIIFVIIVRLFRMTLRISQLTEKNKKLSHHIALYEKDQEDNEEYKSEKENKKNV